MNEIKLELSDPTIFAKCPRCCAHYLGKVVGDYYAKAYPRRREDRSAEEVAAAQVCENCQTPMQFMYEVR